MPQRTLRMLTIGLGLIALLIALPAIEHGVMVGLPTAIVFALPVVALLAATRVPHVALSHAAFPASFMPAIILLPGLYSGPAWGGAGGAATLVIITVLFALFFVSASHGKVIPPLVARLRPVETLPLAPVVTVAALLAGLLATWFPLVSAPPTVSRTAFGAFASVALVALVVGTARRLNLERVAHDADFVRQQLLRARTELGARRRRAVIGISLAALTGAAGLLWYLRRGIL